MELMELSASWKIVIAKETAENKIRPETVATMLRKNSHTVIAKIKRLMLFKFFFGCISVIASAGAAAVIFLQPKKYYLFEAIFSPLEAALFLATMSAFILFMLVYNYLVYRLITRHQGSWDNVRHSLQQCLAIMKKVVKVNIYSDSLFGPVLVGWLWYSYAYQDATLAWNLDLLLLLTLPLAALMLIYQLSKFIQKLKFGSYIQQLETNLEALESN